MVAKIPTLAKIPLFTLQENTLFKTRTTLLTQTGTRNSDAPSYATDPYTSSVDLIRTAFGYSFKERPVKQNQSPEAAR